MILIIRIEYPDGSMGDFVQALKKYSWGHYSTIGLHRQHIACAMAIVADHCQYTLSYPCWEMSTSFRDMLLH